ncbi:hypothetical protein [Methanobacterium petrolearium]|uniref:hypothetical protein n=1 Tax=Methanobacterium petrolearium TaxID=710190 RepID=UPI001AE19AFC|nr:hypothetical protein [Methanobacterium petrolearium]MBP1946332.1 hypothetical protein [Methanobacterium petrolearium]BDZ71435.1 hypothetical protein GCM10025861_19520 [Methanobacterium petrolearium]
MIWTFALNRDYYYNLKEKNEDTWNSAKEVRNGDIILMYTGKPYNSIGFIFKAISNPFEDNDIRRRWNTPAVKISKRIELPESDTISFAEMSSNHILKEWSAVKMRFRGSHFKISDEQWDELKNIILRKNPNLKEDIEILEQEDEIEEYEGHGPIGFYDLNAGRAHIVRDICYLISHNHNITENELFDLLRKNVGDNDLYWRAYYQRSHRNNSPGYNLNSARTLGLVHRNRLKLTESGERLVGVVTENELYDYKYGLGTKQFFYELALKDTSIKKAMEILKENSRLKFYSPTCERANKVAWRKELRNGKYYCKETAYSACNDCDRDFAAHINESSLPFETMIATDGNQNSFVFWMCSRVTPMHLTGSEPRYSGNYIYWDEEAERELDLIEMPEEKKKIAPRIWKITPGEPEKLDSYWPIYTEKGFIGIGWMELERDFREFNSQDELKNVLDEVYGESKSQSAKMIWDFTNEIKVGDYVIANRGKNEVIGIGVINSDYIGPDDPENLNLDEYPHLRKVDWKIIDNIEVTMSFDRKTVTELDGRRWNDIISTYSRMNPEFKIELLDRIYEEFKDGYLDTAVGQDHLKAYENESEKVKETYEDVAAKINDDLDATDDILYGLVPHKGKSIVGFISNIKAFFEKTYEIKPEKFPEIANNYFETIHDFIETDDPEIQEEILEKFVSSEYSKGFGAGTVTPILFFINPTYPLVNNKTVDSVTFLSKLMGETIKIDMELNHYVENKDKL